MELLKLRKEFLKLLTEDSETTDARRKDFNQAIFIKESGNACFNGTNLDMILDKLDTAIKNIRKESSK